MSKINNFFNSWSFDASNRIRFIITFLCVVLGLTMSFTCGVWTGLILIAVVTGCELYKKFLMKQEFIGANVAYTALGWMVALLCYIPFDAFC